MSELNMVYFPAAVALGALHAMEPGHAKALTAAYLIGIKGTKRDSLILGLSVAATHSIVVVAIACLGLWIGNEAFTGEATKWLERGSGFVAIVIGSYMLFRRLALKQNGEHSHPKTSMLTDFRSNRPPGIPDPGALSFHKVEIHAHHHHDVRDHAHMDDDEHARAHAATLPGYVLTGERPSYAQIALFGAAGGMIPCPASITVMLLALSTGRAGLGLLTVLGFSLGLALALVGIGMAIVMGLSRLSGSGRLSWVSKRAPGIGEATLYRWVQEFGLKSFSESLRAEPISIAREVR